MSDTPLLDDTAACPKCWDNVHVTNLCEHEDPDTGPLCIDTCCPRWHELGAAA